MYRRFRAPLRRFVAKLSWERDEAEEIVQDVWLAVIRGARSYRPAAKFTTYLFSIAHCRLQDHWRSRDRRGRAFTSSDAAPDPDEIAAATGATVEATKSRMRCAVARLRAQLAKWRQEASAT